jgi:pimeloyl-ACP methyl ester carboxylesterase
MGQNSLCVATPHISMATKPVIYVLHGAWHGPAYFDSIKQKLEGQGYTVICPQQPTTGCAPPNLTLYDDVAHVKPELESLIGDGQDVLVVMHSYGGLVGTEAAAGLGKAQRVEQGLPGGVIGLFYAWSFLLPKGHHLCTALGGELAPFIKPEVSLGGLVIRVRHG